MCLFSGLMHEEQIQNIPTDDKPKEMTIQKVGTPIDN